MPLSVELLERAEEDREIIWSYTEERWGRDQAVNYLRGLNDTLLRLAEFPEMAPLYAEFSPAVRIHVFRQHLIVYQVTETTLEVIRLLPSRSNWMEVLAR